MFPSFIVFVSSFFEFMIIILLFSSPNTIWYLFAVLTVMFNSVCKYFSLSAMRSTSSIHRRHPILVLLPGISIPMLVFGISWLFHPLLWHIEVLIGHLLVLCYLLY